MTTAPTLRTAAITFHCNRNRWNRVNVVLVEWKLGCIGASVNGALVVVGLLPFQVTKGLIHTFHFVIYQPAITFVLYLLLIHSFFAIQQIFMKQNHLVSVSYHFPFFYVYLQIAICLGQHYHKLVNWNVLSGKQQVMLFVIIIEINLNFITI